MIIAVSGFKGGVAKTTTALRFAEMGETLPFEVFSQNESMKKLTSGKYQHIVFDTPGNPDEDDLLEIASGVDLMILPTIPDWMSYDPLLMLEPKLKGANYRVLVTIAPSHPEKDGEVVRDTLLEAGLPVFQTVVHRRAAFKHASNAGALVIGSEYEALGLEVMALGN